MTSCDAYRFLSICATTLESVATLTLSAQLGHVTTIVSEFAYRDDKIFVEKLHDQYAFVR